MQYPLVYLVGMHMYSLFSTAVSVAALLLSVAACELRWLFPLWICPINTRSLQHPQEIMNRKLWSRQLSQRLIHLVVRPSAPSFIVPNPSRNADVVNGEKNSLILNVENKSGRNITLVSVAGSVHHFESNRLIKNVCWIITSLTFVLNPLLEKLTSIQFDVPLPDGVKLDVPYAFFSEYVHPYYLSNWLADKHMIFTGSRYSSIMRLSRHNLILHILSQVTFVFMSG